MSELTEVFKTIDLLLKSCEIDYLELKNHKIDELFFADYGNQRIINSFLFNFIKIQDKIGAKLFKKVLYSQKEIDDESLPMKDVLNLLEKLKILDHSDNWERLREIRNALTHEYPFDIIERIENIKLAMDGYDTLTAIYQKLKIFCQ